MQRRKIGSSKDYALRSGRDAPPTATVVRHRCGTSPFDKNWLNWDCCGLICAVVTYMLHLYGCYAVSFVLLPPWMSYKIDGGRKMTMWGKFHTFCFCLIAALAIISHFKAMTTDPGSIPPDAEPLADMLDSKDAVGPDSKPKPKPTPRTPKRICRRCNSYKPDRAHHCSICKRCILKMDHHCPWVNNCVGIGNHKYFLLFVFYTCVSCFYAIFLVILRFVECIGHLEKHEPCLDDPTNLLGIVGLVVESMMFGIFTCCMVIDQWEVVISNVTHIDRLKGETFMEDTEGSLAGINEVFGIGVGKRKRGGGRFRPDWLSPFVKVCFPENMKDQIMGFCRPCGFGKIKEDDYDSPGRKSSGSIAEIV